MIAVCGSKIETTFWCRGNFLLLEDSPPGLVHLVAERRFLLRFGQRRGPEDLRVTATKGLDGG